jgi:hypothetical protein
MNGIYMGVDPGDCKIFLALSTLGHVIIRAYIPRKETGSYGFTQREWHLPELMGLLKRDEYKYALGAMLEEHLPLLLELDWTGHCVYTEVEQQ